MLRMLDEAGRVTWATRMKQLLYKLGFGFVWISQDIGNVQLFMSEIDQRLKDIALQNWQSDLNENSKLTNYVQFKTLLNTERYVTGLKEFKLRKALAKLRTSCHMLNIELGRHYYKDKELDFVHFVYVKV